MGFNIEWDGANNRILINTTEDNLQKEIDALMNEYSNRGTSGGMTKEQMDDLWEPAN